MVNLLFVCLGNICRSPAAEGLARVLAKGDPRIGKLDSAGLGDWHVGAPPDARMRRVAAARGFPIDDLRARLVIPEDFDRFDYIFCMDFENLHSLKKMAARHGGKAQVRMLLEGEEIPDPYYGSHPDFCHSFDMIRRGIEAFLEALPQGA